MSVLRQRPRPHRSLIGRGGSDSNPSEDNTTTRQHNAREGPVLPALGLRRSLKEDAKKENTNCDNPEARVPQLAQRFLWLKNTWVCPKNEARHGVIQKRFPVHLKMGTSKQDWPMIEPFGATKPSCLGCLRTCLGDGNAALVFSLWERSQRTPIPGVGVPV